MSHAKDLLSIHLWLISGLPAVSPLHIRPDHSRQVKSVVLSDVLPYWSGYWTCLLLSSTGNGVASEFGVKHFFNVARAVRRARASEVVRMESLARGCKSKVLRSRPWLVLVASYTVLCVGYYNTGVLRDGLFDFMSFSARRFPNL